MADNGLLNPGLRGRQLRAAAIVVLVGFGCWWLLRLPWQIVLVEPFYAVASVILTILSLVAAPLSWLFDVIMLSAPTPSLLMVDMMVTAAAIVYFGGLGWGLARLAAKRRKRWLGLAVLTVGVFHAALLATLSYRAAAGLAAQEAALADSGVRSSQLSPRVLTPQDVQNSFFVVREVVSERDDHHRAAVERQVETLYFDPESALFTERDVDPASVEIERREWFDGAINWMLSLQLLDEPAAFWAKWSGDNVGARIGIFIDGDLVQSPWIRGRLTGGLMVVQLDRSRSDMERLGESLQQAARGRRHRSADPWPPDATPSVHDVAPPRAPEEFRTLNLDAIDEAVALLNVVKSDPWDGGPREQLARLYEEHDLLGAARFFDNTVRLIDGESLVVTPVENPVAWALTPEDLSGRAWEAAREIADVAASGRYEAAAEMAAAEIAASGMSNQVAAEWSWAALSLAAVRADRVSAEVYEPALRTYLMCLEDKVVMPSLGGGKASAYHYLSKLLSEIGDGASGVTAGCLALHYLEQSEEGFPYTGADKAQLVETIERLSARTGGLTCP